MTTELDETLSTIDGLVDNCTDNLRLVDDPRGTDDAGRRLPTKTCAQCGDPTGASPSDDFCSEPCATSWCATSWRADQAGMAPLDGGQRPDEAMPERRPETPLAFLGEPPASVLFAREGHEVLDDVAAFIGRFSAFPDEHCIPALALWYAHTHAAASFYITPRLVLDSAEPASGKTRVLEVAAHLVASPEMTVSVTPAAMFRLISQGPITILFDEVDAIFTVGGGGNEDLRSLLNSGYKAGATIPRCVGDAKDMKVRRFEVFAPAMLAGIAGGMPDTITTRAVNIHMRKRRNDQFVEPYRYRSVVCEAKPVREALAAWVASIAGDVGFDEPDMPEGVADRPAEIWEPLIAIADRAGGHWPDTARAACVHFVLNSGPPTRSHGVQLLADLRELFTRHNADRLPTAILIPALRDMEESPWGDLDGKLLDARRMAKELARYGVRVEQFRHDGTNVKGYTVHPTDRQVGLADAWSRYLPAQPPPALSEGGYIGYNGYTAGQRVSDDAPVTDAPGPEQAGDAA